MIQPVTVFEPMFPEEFKTKKENIEAFLKGLSQFYEGHFGNAIEIFSEIKDFDPAAAAYGRKCKEIMKSTPKNWQGLWVMTKK